MPSCTSKALTVFVCKVHNAVRDQNPEVELSWLSQLSDKLVSSLASPRIGLLSNLNFEGPHQSVCG